MPVPNCYLNVQTPTLVHFRSFQTLLQKNEHFSWIRKWTVGKKASMMTTRPHIVSVVTSQILPLETINTGLSVFTLFYSTMIR